MTILEKQDLENYKAPETLLQDKVILITGAGSGIGKSAALTFALRGATLVLVGRTLSKLELTYDEIEASKGPQPAIFPMNLESAQEQDYQALYESLENEFGQLHGLLHNAAELGPRTPLEHYGIAQWQKVIQVNTTAPFMLTKALLPLLKKPETASIIFTSSSVAKKGRAYWGAYSVSKSAGENLMEIFADELDATTDIRVNTINPGPTRTRMREAAFPAEDPSTLKHPDSIMNQYLFLMGNDSRNVHGAKINI